MLTTNSILSMDQGTLYTKPKSEDDYYARYTSAADKAEPTVQQKPRAWSFLGFEFGGPLAIAPR